MTLVRVKVLNEDNLDTYYYKMICCDEGIQQLICFRFEGWKVQKCGVGRL